MITFNVVKERHGWAIRMGKCMVTPFRSKELAIREAHCIADAIRRHGVSTEVIVDGAEPSEPLGDFRDSEPSRLDRLRRDA